MDKRKLAAVIVMILLAAVSRLIPHPYNFTPFVAMALFGGAYLGNRFVALAAPVAALLISDVIINVFTLKSQYGSFLYDGFAYVYGAVILTVILGSVVLKKISGTKLAATTVFSTLLFFVVTNFGAWTVNAWSAAPLYARSLDGLAAAYVAGIPFLRNAFVGDIFYAAVLFGLYELAARKTSVFAQAKN